MARPARARGPSLAQPQARRTRSPRISTAGGRSPSSIWAAARAPTCAPPRRCWGPSSTGRSSTTIRACSMPQPQRLDGLGRRRGPRRRRGSCCSRAPSASRCEFRRADLAGDLEAALGPSANLVTASALFDLASADVHRQASPAAVATRKAAFYTVLTYDGDQRWTPEHEADAACSRPSMRISGATRDSGISAGPDAPDALSEAFAALGYAVQEGDSAWRLGAGDAALIAELQPGFAEAVRRDRPGRRGHDRGLARASLAPAPSSATPTRWPCRRRTERRLTAGVGVMVSDPEGLTPRLAQFTKRRLIPGLRTWVTILPAPPTEGSLHGGVREVRAGCSSRAGRSRNLGDGAPRRRPGANPGSPVMVKRGARPKTLRGGGCSRLQKQNGCRRTPRSFKSHARQWARGANPHALRERILRRGHARDGHAAAGTRDRASTPSTIPSSSGKSAGSWASARARSATSCARRSTLSCSSAIENSALTFTS